MVFETRIAAANFLRVYIVPRSFGSAVSPRLSEAILIERSFDEMVAIANTSSL